MNFKLNDNDLAVLEGEPTDPDDSLHVLKILTGDSIFLDAVVKPQDRAKSLSWDTNGDGVWESDLNNEPFILVSFPDPGFQKVTLQVNGKEELTVSKWVFVEDAEPAAPVPMLFFRKPSGASATVSQKSYGIEVETQHVGSEEELSVTVNSEPAPFSFDSETGLLTSRLLLGEGSNFVRVSAGMASAEVEIVYKELEPTPVRREPTSPPPPPAGPKPPTVKITAPPKTTNSSELALEIKTTDVAQKSQLAIKVNGTPVNNRNYSFSRSKQKWEATVPLREGPNSIEVTATTPQGTKTSKAEVTYIRKLPSTPALVGLPSSEYSKACNSPSGNNTFAVTLMPSQDVELQSFYVYSTDCGGLDIVLKGGQKSERFKAALTAGRNQISFGSIDALLEGGKAYTLTCVPIANYGGCQSKSPPRLEDAKDCGITLKDVPALKIEQKETAFLYDLKILY